MEPLILSIVLFIAWRIFIQNVKDKEETAYWERWEKEENRRLAKEEAEQQVRIKEREAFEARFDEIQKTMSIMPLP